MKVLGLGNYLLITPESMTTPIKESNNPTIDTMKINLLPFASLMLFLVLIGCNEASETADTPEVEETESSWTLYGGEIGTEPGLAANDVRNLLDDSGQVEARFEGIIDATCAKKGCWMSMVSDEDTVFVQFKDYGFFVPTEGMEARDCARSGLL